MLYGITKENGKTDPLAPSRSYLKVEEAYYSLGYEPARMIPLARRELHQAVGVIVQQKRR